MKKLLLKLVLLIAAFGTILGIEKIYSKDVDTTEIVSVYVAKERIEVGTQLLEYMIEPVMIPKHLASEYIIKEHVTGYMLTTIEEGEFIYKHQLSDCSPLQLKDDERIITLNCNVVEGNGWIFTINEKVDVVMIATDETIVIKDAMVCRIFDENMSNELVPEYISLVVDESSALNYYSNVSHSEVFISKKE